jgi:hypothetical protein
VKGQEVEQALEAFKADLETEVALLRQLQELAQHQRESSDTLDFERFQLASLQRDKLTRTLIDLEQDLSRRGAALESMGSAAAATSSYAAIVALRRATTELVNDILECDRAAMKVLADAEIARRAALASLERGETTLAAYRRVLAAEQGNKGLLDSRG